MTAYYLLQQLAVSVALACCAVRVPQWFHLSCLPRVLLAVSLTPQAIGLIVMALALTDINSPAIYIHAPMVLAVALIAVLGPGSARHLIQKASRIHLPLPGAVIVVIGCFVTVVLVGILYENARTLDVTAHDFNVYLAGAKSFAASPGVASIPSFYGAPGDVIVVHPHSFLFEAYLSHALLLQGIDPSYPALDFLSRLAQQISVIYLSLSIAAVAIAIGGCRAAVAAVCLALCVPWVYYIAGALSRDGFRMVPLFGFMLIMCTLANNFRSKMSQRGAVAGLFAALAIMSHTLNMLFLVLSGASILGFAILSRRSNWRRLGLFIAPALLVCSLAVFRYVQNYVDTGNFMGYGLQYSIYKGTWIESALGGRWTKSAPNSMELLETLFIRYGELMQIATLTIALIVALLPRATGGRLYLGVLIGVWVPLLILISNLFNYAGINLSNALLINARYPLPLFLLSAALLSAGIVRLIGYLGARFRLPGVWSSWLVACLTVYAAYFAYDALQGRAWRSRPAQAVDVAQIRFLGRAVQCLGTGQHWLMNDDRWSVYFGKRPSVFPFTLAGRPLIAAQDAGAASAALKALNIKFAAFVEAPKLWHGSPLYAYIKSAWVPINMPGEESKRELWASPDVAECLRADKVNVSALPVFLAYRAELMGFYLIITDSA